MLPEAEQVLKVRVWFHLQHHQSGLPWFVLEQLSSVEILWIYSPVRPHLVHWVLGSDMQIEQSEPNSAPGYIHATPLKSLSAFFVCLMHCSISCLLYNTFLSLTQPSAVLSKKWWWTSIAVTFSDEKYHNAVYLNIF